MTTAPENRGGMRPTAPQNNPANVSGTGGAGQSGNYSGFAYGQNSQLNASRVEGNAAVASVGAAGPETPAMPQLETLLDNIGGKYSNITDGASVGSPVGPEALPKNISANTRPDENAAIIARYLPDLIHAASFADAPDSYKRFVNYLASK